MNSRRMQSYLSALHLDRALPRNCLSGDLGVSYRQLHDHMNISAQGASGEVPEASIEIKNLKMLKSPLSISMIDPNSLTILSP